MTLPADQPATGSRPARHGWDGHGGASGPDRHAHGGPPHRHAADVTVDLSPWVPEPEGRPLAKIGGLAVAGTALTLAAVEAVAALLSPAGSMFGPLVAVVLVQAVLITCWFLVVRPAAPIMVTVAGVGVAIGCDAVALAAGAPSAARFADVLGLSFAGVVVLQLARGAARSRVTESLGATLGLAVVVAAAATHLVLVRLPGGGEALTVAVVAAAAAVGSSALIDLGLSRPRLAAGVARGLPGVLVGLAVAVVAGVAAMSVLGSADGVAVFPSSAPEAAISGAVVGVVSVLVVLGIDLGRAGRVQVGDGPGPVPVRWLLGPATGMATAGAAAYLIAVIGG